MGWGSKLSLFVSMCAADLDAGRLDGIALQSDFLLF
jgi:hypothetical protein